MSSCSEQIILTTLLSYFNNFKAHFGFWKLYNAELFLRFTFKIFPQENPESYGRIRIILILLRESTKNPSNDLLVDSSHRMRKERSIP